MGGQADAITTEVKRNFTAGRVAAATRWHAAVSALGSAGGTRRQAA